MYHIALAVFFPDCCASAYSIVRDLLVYYIILQYERGMMSE